MFTGIYFRGFSTVLKAMTVTIIYIFTLQEYYKNVIYTICRWRGIAFLLSLHHNIDSRIVRELALQLQN